MHRVLFNNVKNRTTVDIMLNHGSNYMYKLSLSGRFIFIFLFQYRHIFSTWLVNNILFCAMFQAFFFYIFFTFFFSP